MKRSFAMAMVIIFVALCVALVVLGRIAPEYHIAALHFANVLMLTLSLSAYMLVNKKIADRPQSFVTGVYSASLLKLMVCMGAMLAYVMVNRERIHKPTVFALMGVYAVYSATETILLSKMARTKKQ